MFRSPMLMSVTTNPDAARAFYAEVLGFRLLEDTPFALVFDAAGTPLRVQKLPPEQSYTPLPCTLLAWSVGDIEDACDALVARGAVFVRYPHFDQDERGIWSVPGARVAWFKDPDGNTLSLTEHLS